MYNTFNPNLIIRYANENDTAEILRFIKKLAKYEKMEDKVLATEEILYSSLFIKKQAEVIIAEYNKKPIGFALFFHNFSTLVGKSNLYLEDLFVNEEERGRGAGKAMLAVLAKIALERDCERLDWVCLDWNTSSVNFYKSLGAKAMDDWTTFRVSGETLVSLSKIL